jgi:hypothetical protein
MTLDTFIKRNRARYIRKARALRRQTERMAARDVAAFVLCTPRQTYERAVRQWRGWRETGRVTGPLAATRMRYIAALPRRLRRARGESIEAWHGRLRRAKGLGVAKAPFLASLLEPTTRDVPVCVDIWMLRGLGWQDAERASESRILAAQRLCEAMARYHAMPRFAWQWAAWDYFRTRGRDTAQGVLTVSETRIEEDLR